MIRGGVIVATLVVATASHAEPRGVSLEGDAGATRIENQIGPEIGAVVGVRLDPKLVVGVRAIAFHLPEVEEHTPGSDVSTIDAAFSAIVVGPTVRFDVPRTPLWVAGGPAIAVGWSQIDTSHAFALEARVGVSFWRIEDQAFCLSLDGRNYLSFDGAWQASATIGYIVN